MALSALQIQEIVDATKTPTPEQVRVIEAPRRPLLVVAGAGSGKTETMSMRVLWLLANHPDLSPSSILGLTFTRKAAGELGERLRERIRLLSREMPQLRERLDEDIRAIVSAGNVTVHTECRIDAEGMRRLSEEYDAVYVAIGAQGGKTLKLEGADAEGVMSAVDLLTKIGDDEYPDFTGKNVVVIGGGNVAMDCARTSVRAGAASVTVAYRRRLEDMTALRAEIDSAMQEGVEMMTLQAPDHIEVENGQAVALYTQPQFIGPVKRGRPAPQKADKPLVRVPADVVLIAVGQDIESAPFEEAGMQADRTYFEADDGLKSVGSLDNVFVGGDCQVGPKTVIIAIGAGKVAARNIDDYLGFNHELDCGVEVPPAAANWRQPCGRVNIVERPARERKGDFDAVEVEMSAEEAFQEARRCLRCDHFGCGVLDEGRVQYV